MHSRWVKDTACMLVLKDSSRSLLAMVPEHLLNLLSLMRLLHDILLPLGLCVVMLELLLQLLDVELLRTRTDDVLICLLCRALAAGLI